MIDKPTQLKILQGARTLLDEYGFCKGTLAVNDDGEDEFFDSANAASFCTRGAIFRAALDLGYDIYFRHNCPIHNRLFAKLDLKQKVDWHETAHELVEWNNAKERTKEEVLEVFDGCITDLKGELNA